jgi:hypothetical protein
MAEEYTVTRRGKHSKATGFKGKEAGKGAKYDAMAEQQERQRYRAAQGASGIGGARKAATPEFRAKEDAHIKKWRARRAAKAAKKRAQKKAVPKE